MFLGPYSLLGRLPLWESIFATTIPKETQIVPTQLSRQEREAIVRNCEVALFGATAEVIVFAAWNLDTLHYDLVILLGKIKDVCLADDVLVFGNAD